LRFFYISTRRVAEEFILEDPKSYVFLSNKWLPIPGVDDAAEFQATVNAMSIMGMTNEDYAGKCDNPGGGVTSLCAVSL
jgi:myosin heavy subunit